MSARLLALRGTPARLVKAFARLAAPPDTATPMFPMLVVEAVTSRPWSSATFDGERHRFELRLHGDALAVGDALDRLIELLPEADFDLPGEIVAEARLASVRVDPDPGVAALALVIEVVTVVD
ncbi:tail completion protein gp17 [Glacieibacterium frigidum]|uniref:DUF3168 domain-containing protein n=1 Tax=Glacieibacterium frigidum TaxID=2593303 RepID=A0A552UH02_9SPHN|nr:DUF3168 domain-containing protein [Glacieibacterium frigidum]TRW17502.1 DUF3168 domain-containing protein [Glacieibacterium frigidum]